MRLRDVAHVVRSKNAGPYLVTVDVVLPDPTTYRALINIDLLNPADIAHAYRIAIDEIHSVRQYEPANCLKVNLRRRIESGGIGDQDVLGMQFHTPIADLPIDPRVFSRALAQAARASVAT